MNRSKVLVVPYTRDKDGNVLFLMVKDRKFDEWTFISGTCKKRNMEHPLLCASRELKEETKDVVDLDLNTWPHHHISFDTMYQDASHSKKKHSANIYTTCHVYFLDIGTYPRSPSFIVNEFMITNKLGKQYNENTDIGFFQHKDFNKSIRLWKFISQVVMKNVTFRKVFDNL